MQEITLKVKIESGNTIKKSFKYARYRRGIESAMSAGVFKAGGVIFYDQPEITYTRYAPRGITDFDNLVAGWKPVQDALKKCGFFRDDGMKDIKVEYLQEKSDKYYATIRII